MNSTSFLMKEWLSSKAEINLNFVVNELRPENATFFFSLTLKTFQPKGRLLNKINK